MSKFLCMGVPDYLKDHHHVHGKLAILEQHQIELRKNYLTTTTDNGLNPDTLGLRYGLRELGTKTANLVALASDDDDSDSKQPLVHNGGKSQNKRCPCQDDTQELSTIGVGVAKILELMEDNVLKEQRKAEWSMLGALIDRILLIVLIIAASTTTLYIYVLAPVIRK